MKRQNKNEKQNNKRNLVNFPSKKNFRIKEEFPSKQNNQEIQKVINLIKDFLQKHNYHKTLETLKIQKTNMNRIRSPKTQSDYSLFLKYFDKGLRQQFLQKWSQLPYFIVSKQFAKKIQFEIQIYFYIYPIHPSIKKNGFLPKQNVQNFKKYLQTRGHDLSKTNDFLAFYALPYIPDPKNHSAVKHIFRREWIQQLRKRLEQFLNNIKNQSQHNKLSLLQEICQRHFNNIFYLNNINQKQEKIKQIQKENQNLYQLIEDYSIKFAKLQHNFKSFAESSKFNLIQAQSKWFQLTKNITFICRKFIRTIQNIRINKTINWQNVQLLIERVEKYQKFMNSNIDELISQSQQISIFDKPSYLTENQISITPGNKPICKQSIKIQNKKYNKFYPLDYYKINKCFLEESEKKQKERNVCLLLQALRKRFNNVSNSYQRRQVIIAYSINDLCGLRPQNQATLKILINNSSKKIIEYYISNRFYLRLINNIALDFAGRQYLSTSQTLLLQLIKIFKNEKQDSTLRRQSLGTLQKLSLLKKCQNFMTEKNLIETILNLLEQGRKLSSYSWDFLTALLMNLSMSKSGKTYFFINKQSNQLQLEIMKLFYKILDLKSEQSINFINMTIFSSLQVPGLKEQAKKLGLQQKLIQLINLQPQQSGLRIHFKYIINKLNTQQELAIQQDIEEEQKDDIDNQESIDQQEEDSTLVGQQLLMKEYALLGPQSFFQMHAVKTMIEQKKIIFMTSRKNTSSLSRPMTPSIIGIQDLHQKFK